MSKHSRPFYVFSGIAGFIATAVVFSTLAMLLWNALLPELFGLPVLSWLQTAGIFVLCRVLFGGMTSGFRGGTFDKMGRGRNGANLFRGAWAAMSDEQRQNLADKIKKHPHGFDPRFDGFKPWAQNTSGDAQTDEKKDE
jgi:hypothetical protein